jgi:L-cysteine/cystine lyase
MPAADGSHNGLCAEVLGIGVFSRFVDLPGLRAEFPVLRKLAYLNAGTDGPLSARAVRAASEELQREAEEGRTPAHFERRAELSGELRALYATALGCDTTDLALTTSTSEGIAQVIGGLELGHGDEIVTSDEEHPGLQGALVAARECKGVTVRAVPLAQIADAVGPKTRLLACSHVGWMSGSLAPRELAEVDIPVLLDGAQGVGAVPVDVGALGCDAYAGSGQKWLCGPDGTGMLYVSPALRERLQVLRRSYPNLENPNDGLEARLHEDARRFDSQLLSAETLACALVATTLLESIGWGAVHERARTLAARLVELLGERGIGVGPRGESTLVSFESADPEAERARLAEGDVVLRDIPGRPWLRASVGAWNDEDDLERLIGMLSL